MFACCKNKGRLFGVALLLTLIIAGGWWFGCPKTVAVVGNSQISEADIGYRIGVEEAYGTAIEQPAALLALIKDTLEREVSMRAGVVVDEKDLDAFSAAVDKHSKAPQVLKAVKQVFAGNGEAYRRIYLAPKIINMKLHSWFSRDAEMQKQARAMIQKAYALAVAGNDFKKVAQTVHLRFAIQDYKTDKKQAPDALRGYFPHGIAMLSPGFQKLLNGLKVGEIAQTISEDGTTYRVVRLLKKKEGIYKTAEIIAAKASFDPWFRKQADKISVHIKDKQMRAGIAAKYPGVLSGFSLSE